MKQCCINVVPTLFHRRALTLYQRCATLKIWRRILFHFHRQINVFSTLIHNVETTLIQRWNVGWVCYKAQLIANVCFLTLQGMREKAIFHRLFEKLRAKSCFRKTRNRWPQTTYKKESFESLWVSRRTLPSNFILSNWYSCQLY